MATYQPTHNIGEAYQCERGNGVVHTVGALWNMGTTVLGLNDVLAGPYVPAGARVIDVQLSATDCDSGTTLVMDVGDSDTDRLIDGATTGQAGGTTNTMVVANRGYQYTAETQINVLIQAAATGAGTDQRVMLLIRYLVD